MRYRFGPFEVDTVSKELRKNGVPIKLGEQPFKVLASLLERAGEEVPRAELQHRLWPDGTYVDFDRGINSAVNKLRDALADSAERARYIETIPTRGYRFLATVESETPAGQADREAVAPPMAVSASPTVHAETSASRGFAVSARRFGVGAMLAVTALTGAAIWALSLREPAADAVRTLLILPLQSANAVDSDYLGQGISEQVTARLAALPGIRLISPAAADRIGAEKVSPQEAGRRLNVDAVLYGSVLRTEDKIRVNAQMIRSRDGQVLWAEGGLNVEGNDLIEAERQLATTIAGRLRQSLSVSERGIITRRPTSRADAYELFVRGKLALRKGGRDNVHVAEKLFQEATKLDSDFAEAYAWLALARYRRFGMGDAGEELKRASLDDAHKALALDASVTAARLALISIFHATGQAEEGLRQAAVLRENGANDTEALDAIAQAYHRAGMPDRAIAFHQRALESDPESQALRTSIASDAFWARQYELGLRVLHTPSSRLSFWGMTNALGAGRNDLARAAALATMEQANAFTFAMCWQVLKEVGTAADMDAARAMWRAKAAQFETDSQNLRNERIRIGLGIMYASLGDPQKAREQARLALEANPGDPWTLFYAADLYGQLGDEAKALESLRQAADGGFLSISYLEFQMERPLRGLYRIRNDPRFREIREGMAAKIERLRRQY